MREGQSKVIYRADYQPPAFWIDTVELSFDLDPAKTRVLNKMRVRRNPDLPPQPLRLDGEELNLARVLVGGQGTSFKLEDGQLVLENAHVTGPMVGATVRGKVDYRTQRLQLGGTYVPLSGFNRSFAPIPILGPLLTGPRGEGVLGLVAGGAAHTAVSGQERIEEQPAPQFGARFARVGRQRQGRVLRAGRQPRRDQPGGDGQQQSQRKKGACSGHGNSGGKAAAARPHSRATANGALNSVHNPLSSKQLCPLSTPLTSVAPAASFTRWRKVAASAK